MHGLRHALNSAEHDFSKVKKSVDAFLAATREGFPRFYFFSDDQLLGLFKDTPQNIIGVDLTSCFNFQKVTSNKQDSIMSLHSKHNEVLVCPSLNQGPFEHK